MTSFRFPRGSSGSCGVSVFRFPRRSKLKSYRSNISLTEFNGKLYVDPEFGFEVPEIKIQYAIFSSKWDIEEVPEDNRLKIVHRDTGDSITLGFKTITDRIEFVKNIYASRPVKQLGKGMNLEPLANMNVLPKKQRREPFRKFTPGSNLKEKIETRVFGEPEPLADALINGLVDKIKLRMRTK